MNFDSMTTDDLHGHLPQSEDNRWEFKDALLLTKKACLIEELGKQVSAMANTGGGYVVIGINDKTRDFQNCEQFVGKQPMKDYLVNLIGNSVEYPLSDFRVHRIPHSLDSHQSVFVISIPDSPSAPHQSKGDKHYYWRLDGKSEIAPHFHLELLRTRFTKSVLEIELVEHELRVIQCGRRDRRPAGTPPVTSLQLNLDVSVRNASLYAAQSWGVHAKYVGNADSWESKNGPQPLSVGVCVRGKPGDLLPDERAVVRVEVSTMITTVYQDMNDHPYHVMGMLTSVALALRPVSQNFVGRETLFGYGIPHDDHCFLVEQFMIEMRNQGCDLWNQV